MTALLAACARACRDGKSHADPDLRPWGGGYWFQNTRHMYWYALGAGDLDLLDPLFGMYMRQLPLLKERTQQWYVILSSVANSEVGANVAFDCNHSLLSYERKNKNNCCEHNNKTSVRGFSCVAYFYSTVAPSCLNA